LSSKVDACLSIRKQFRFQKLKEAMPSGSLENMLRGEAMQKSDLGGAGAIEGVGLQDVSAGLQELGVDVGDDIRACDDQQVIVAPQLMRVLLVPITPEVLLTQPEAAHEFVPYTDPQQKVWWKRLRSLYTGLAFRQDTCVLNMLSKR